MYTITCIYIYIYIYIYDYITLLIIYIYITIVNSINNCINKKDKYANILTF